MSERGDVSMQAYINMPSKMDLLPAASTSPNGRAIQSFPRGLARGHQIAVGQEPCFLARSLAKVGYKAITGKVCRAEVQKPTQASEITCACGFIDLFA